MILAGDQKIDVPVQTAEDRKIAEIRGDIGGDAIVEQSLDPQRAAFQRRLRHREAEAGVGAPVLAELLAVDEHAADLVGAFKFEKGPLPGRIDRQRFAVERRAVVWPVVRVPGMRQGDRRPLRLGDRGKDPVGQAGKGPGLVQ